MQKSFRSALLLPMVLAVCLMSGCAATQGAMTQQEIEVEGRVSVRGNEPFTAVMLETDAGHWYKLNLTDDQRRSLVNPSIQRARGTVSLGDWNGRPFAVLTVTSIQRVER